MMNKEWRSVYEDVQDMCGRLTNRARGSNEATETLIDCYIKAIAFIMMQNKLVGGCACRSMLVDMGILPGHPVPQVIVDGDENEEEDE